MPARLSSALVYPIPRPSRPLLRARMRTVEPRDAHAARMRVAFVTETYPPEANGAAMTVGQLVESLVQRWHMVQLIRPRQSPDDRPRYRPYVEEILTAGQALPFDRSMHFGWFETDRLVSLWRARHPDVVHVATEGPLGVSALAAAEKLGIGVSTSFHTNFDRYASHYGFGWLRFVALWHLRRFHNRAACTLVPTRQMLADLECGGYRNLRIVPRGVDAQLFNPSKRSMELRCRWGCSPGTRPFSTWDVWRRRRTCRSLSRRSRPYAARINAFVSSSWATDRCVARSHANTRSTFSPAGATATIWRPTMLQETSCCFQA
ncbi:MAG: glycosyltransferase [Vicinamibacteria bacterium]|nr:glycosyltransferase [Vicinamibacteria bacterium]